MFADVVFSMPPWLEWNREEEKEEEGKTIQVLVLSGRRNWPFFLDGVLFFQYIAVVFSSIKKEVSESG